MSSPPHIPIPKSLPPPTASLVPDQVQNRILWPRDCPRHITSNPIDLLSTACLSTSTYQPTLYTPGPRSDPGPPQCRTTPTGFLTHERMSPMIPASRARARHNSTSGTQVGTMVDGICAELSSSVLIGSGFHGSTSRKHIPQYKINSIRGSATRRLASICNGLEPISSVLHLSTPPRGSTANTVVDRA